MEVAIIEEKKGLIQEIEPEELTEIGLSMMIQEAEELISRMKDIQRKEEW